MTNTMIEIQFVFLTFCLIVDAIYSTTIKRDNKMLKEQLGFLTEQFNCLTEMTAKIVEEDDTPTNNEVKINRTLEEEISQRKKLGESTE